MPKKKTVANQPPKQHGKDFHIELLNGAQKLAWTAFQQHDVLFLIGPAGCGKTFLSCAFAVKELLSKSKSKIILTRPIVEAGESLGYLPGDFYEKVNPYMMPMYDCLDKLVGKEGTLLRERLMDSIEIAPLAFMRGRAEPMSNLLPTPDGNRRMGDIQVGDEVFGSNGEIIKVTGVFPQGKKRVCRIKFTDGTSIVCSEDHLWNTQTRSEKKHGKGYTTKTTKKIAETLRVGHKNNHEIPIVSNPVRLSSSEVLLNPYLLGVILGDGCCFSNAGVTLTNVDESVITAISAVLPDGLSLKKTKGIEYRIIGDRCSSNSVRVALKELGLWGKKSYEKFIPESYLWNSVEVRSSVLQGLLDTDGFAFFNKSGKSRLHYYTTSPVLANQVVWLTQSLGGVAHLKLRSHNQNKVNFYDNNFIKHNLDSFVVDIVLPKEIAAFRCERKLARMGDPVCPKRFISDIEWVGEEECQCISVSAEDSLYLTENFIVTHNTFDNAVCLLDEAQNCSMQQLKLFMTRFGKNSKIIITGDPNQSDLRGNVALIQAVWKLRNVSGIGVVEFKNNSIVRHPLVGSILDALAEEGEVNHSYTPVFDDPGTVEEDDHEYDDVPSYYRSKKSKEIWV
jgi:phosphate starvation-inducible PhoH-like protein